DKRKAVMVSLDHLLEIAHRNGRGCSLIAKYLSVNPEAEILADIQTHELFALLDHLPQAGQHRRDTLIFKRHTVEGCSSSQLAGNTCWGLKVSSIESIIRRTRQKLFGALRAEGYRGKLGSNGASAQGIQGKGAVCKKKHKR